MKEHSIHLRPMSERPTSIFVYVYHNAISTCHRQPESFSQNQPEAVGWIPVKPDCKITPEEGKWYKVNILGKHHVMIFSGGGFESYQGGDTTWRKEQLKIIAEMKEVNE